jgi:hypothetical protein
MNPSLQLPDVTLVAVTSVAIAATARAVARCLEQASFGVALWISDQPPPDFIAKNVVWHRVEPITSRTLYSKFLLRRLVDHVETSHALCIQWDGYILDAAKWDPAFLDCDYIGAPWPHFRDTYKVGNGGFSLRSRRLLAASARLPDDTGEPEDVMICRTSRPALERDNGIVFATTDLASRFAFERQRASLPTFGFHGIFNMVDLVAPAEIAELLIALEPSLLAPNEQRDVLAWALRKGRWQIAWRAYRRISHARRAAQRADFA